MSTIGYYKGINLIDTSAVASANLFNRDKIAKDAQDLADECGCVIEAWQRDDDGERTSHTGILAQPKK